MHVRRVFAKREGKGTADKAGTEDGNALDEVAHVKLISYQLFWACWQSGRNFVGREWGGSQREIPRSAAFVRNDGNFLG
jgi:hypothetical protein